MCLPKDFTNDKPFKVNTMHIVQRYSEYSTIQGIIYVFQKHQTVVGKIFWFFVVAFMVILGSYWSIQSYQSWDDTPVLTTVMSTAHPIEKVEFPAITICSNGMSDDVISAAMAQEFLNFLIRKNLSLNVSPFDIQDLLYNKESFS